MIRNITSGLVLLALFSAGILFPAGSHAQSAAGSVKVTALQADLSLYENTGLPPERAATSGDSSGLDQYGPAKGGIVLFSETYVVTHTGDSGAGSLRDALEQANAGGGGTIMFDIGGAPPFVIQPLTALPGIFEMVTIDGTSQPGYAPGSPVVVLDGTLAGTGETGIGVNGLRLYPGSDGSYIKGLVIIGFQPGLSDGNIVNGIGIEIGSNNNTVEGCFIGIGPDGSTPLANDFGIGIEGSYNLIGGDSQEKSNLVAGNTKTGIDIASLAVGGQGNPVGYNIIRGNLLGTDGSGGEARPNNTNIRVAGDEGYNQVFDNLVSGANMAGIVLASSAWYNTVRDNLVGTDVTGTQALGNRRDGIMVQGPFNTILNNLVSGNSQDRAVLTAGIHFAGSLAVSNQVRGNRIGTDITGTMALPNEMDGVIIRGSNNTLGNNQGGGNIISGNRLSGVVIINFLHTANNNFLAGNNIGVNASDEPLGNGVDGVQVAGGLQNSLSQNAIAHNGRHGIRLETLTVGNDTFVPRRSNITMNAIHSNALLGISLGSNAIIPNDPGDEDMGPNDLLNFPEISQVLFDEGASELHITYSVPTSAYNLSWGIRTQFFATNPGERQGKTYLGEDYFFQADFNNGGKTVILTLPAGANFTAGDEITATANDIDNNTSQFAGIVESEPMAAGPILFTITAAADPAQGGSIEINSAPYTDPVEVEEGELVTLVAIPADGWEFLFWSENTIPQGSDETLEFTAEGDRNILAHFAPEETQVNYGFQAVIMQGEGSVFVNDELYTGELFFPDGITIKVEAVPADGWEFSHWEMDLSGTDPIQELLMDFPKEVYAYFIQPTEPEFFEMTLFAEPEEGGEVYGAGTYEAGETVQVSAVANPGFVFLYWSLDGQELPVGETFAFQIDAPYTLTAHFEAEDTGDPGDPVLGECSFSQGYWFARPQTVWPHDVTIGGHTFSQEDGKAFWPANTNTRRAFTQYATIVLSGVDLNLFPELAQAMAVIGLYFANDYPAPASRLVNQAAGFIGDWVDENHCPEEDPAKTLAGPEPGSVPPGGQPAFPGAQGLQVSAYPNPFASEAILAVTLSEASFVRVEVYNMTGMRVALLHEGALEGNQRHELRFSAGDLPPGLYFFRVQANDRIHMERVVRSR